MLHTNLEIKKNNRDKFIQKKAMKVAGIGVAFLSIFFVGSRLFAASSISWNFDSANDYTVSDSNKIEVSSGEVRLKLGDSFLQEDSLEEFNAGSYYRTEFSNNALTIASSSEIPSDTAGLIAQYKFENNLSDSKATYTATSVGSPGFTSEAQVGSAAAQFNSTDGYISLSPSIDLRGTTTLTTWVKPTLSRSFPILTSSSICASGGRGWVPYSLQIDTNGSILYHMQSTGNCSGGAGQIQYRTAAGIIQSNKWYHIGFSVVNNSGSRILSLFVNGVNVPISLTLNQIAYPNTLVPTYIGAFTNLGGYGSANGVIDDLQIYNRSLTSSEIFNEYALGSGRYGEFTSRVIDLESTGVNDIEDFLWTPKQPYFKELPNNQGVETDYSSRNVDMTGNIGLWHMNGNWSDFSGNNHHGSGAGNAASNSTAFIGSNSGSFDGTGDYVSINDSAALKPANQLSLSAWANPNGSQVSNGILAKRYADATSPFNSYLIGTSGYKFNFCLSTNSSQTCIESDNYTFGSNWYHIAGTYNGVEMKLYVNGNMVASANKTGDINYSAMPVFIGSARTSADYFKGNIDESAIFGRALSDLEIGNLYLRGIANVKYQIRSCDDSLCSGESFIGPDGTTSTYYSELSNLTTNLPSFNVSEKVINRYYQYKAILSTNDSSHKPEINSVSMSYLGYPTDEPSLYLTNEEDLGAIPASINKFCEGTLDVSNNCTTTSTKPAGTEIYHQICNDTVDNCNTNSTWKYWDGVAWENATSSQFNTASEINSNILDFIPTTRYFAFKSFLSSEGQTTPVLTDISTSVVLDSTAPTTNATNIHVNGSVSSEWARVKPTIEWNSGEDNQDGVGILGYCVSLDESNIGSTQNLNPATSGGVLQGIDDGVSQNYCPYIATGTSLDLASISGLNLVTNKEYYFSIKAVDVAGNIWSGAGGDYQNLFSFKYDGTAPTNPAFISMPSNFIASKDVTITWPVGGVNGASDLGSGLAGLQYRIGQNGTWYGDLHNGNQDLTDLLVDDGTYTMDEDIDYPNLIDGSNIIYFRTIDNAGNISVSNVTGVLKINTTAPNQVQNLQVTPNDNEVNEYSFNWGMPDAFIGEASGLTYCYTINTLPNGNNCTYTAAGITSIPTDAYATQPGTNNFYVVAKDEAGNINFDTYSAVQFTYSGEAPGIPLNVDVSDLSVKETEDWKLAVTWATPTNVGAGVSSYKIYRSITEDAACNTNLNAFQAIADVQGTSFIDTDLNQQDYYYCVKACDSANNCSAVSTTVSNFPTGKYTSPANLISGPTLNAVTTRKAVISWTTDRRSDSKIQIGLSSNDYFEAESAVSAQVTSHTVALDNLIAGTTYYYRAKWTDEDGNTGISEEKSFTTSPAPKIIDINTTIIGVDFALIQLKVRDANRVSILYGVNGNFNNIQSIQTSLQESQYTINLEDLIDGSDYSYQIVLEDVEGGEYDTLEVNNFKTLPRPTVSNIQIEEVKNVAQPTVKVNWTSNTEVSSILTYYPEGREDEARDSVELDLLTTHEMTLVGLRAETRYILFAKGIDKLGNEAISSPQFFTTATDTRPPKISNVKVEAINPDSNETTSQIIVSWETDEMSTSQVEYGEGTNGSYAQSTQIDKNLGYKHVVIITNLKPASVYHLKAISEDNSKNTSETSNIVTITPKQQETAFDIVLKGLGDIFSFL